MMSDKDNNLLKSDILTMGSELSEKLNAIGVPNTFGKASEGKDNLMSIIRMTISGFDMIIEQIREILRDYYNKSEVNTLLNGKSDTSHNHDGADVILSNNNDVGTEIGNIENSIANLERVFFTTITPSAITSASTWENVSNEKIRLHRVGNICIASGGFRLKAKYSTIGWKQIATLPIGYKSDNSVELRNAALSVGKIADRLQVSEYKVNIFCTTANTEATEYIRFNLVWATNDDYPSQ